MKRRYTDKSQIEREIDKCIEEHKRLILEANALEEVSARLFQVRGMQEDAIMKKEASMKLRVKANNLIQIRARKLKEKMAEIQTLPLPFLEDTSVSSLLEERKRNTGGKP
jgi:hypothetical protein